ncbi:helicase C-terminal domain-containing protein [Corynebacterium genitalium ATCC 33030]|uniref:ATP-binding domain-containing protein n=1 Tax=Corynebacterium genitalium TaxID=38288 RepID=UPI0018DE0455|nr:helicase C-terminal domain-containing protein [Corynebacterium genitalium]UUA89066.1 helicase C-terminal domain-containing protein [Corynebacterium genitalium ATCC 33030]
MVRRLGKGDTPRGRRLVLPAKYVREHLELGYASTVHRAQGSTVDTAHTLVDPDTASRELLYVGLTRGMHENHAYVIQPDPHEVEPHLDPPEELTRVEQLARVLARSDADLSATETRQVEVDKRASLATLLDEYDLLAREAQTERWEALIDIAPFSTGEIGDEVFTSPYYEYLEAALARHEASGHDVTAALTALAPQIPPADEDTDPAAELAAWLDRATLNQSTRRAANRRREPAPRRRSHPDTGRTYLGRHARRARGAAGAHRVRGGTAAPSCDQGGRAVDQATRHTGQGHSVPKSVDEARHDGGLVSAPLRHR